MGLVIERVALVGAHGELVLESLELTGERVKLVGESKKL
jgi:hypothetical protein